MPDLFIHYHELLELEKKLDREYLARRRHILKNHDLTKEQQDRELDELRLKYLQDDFELQFRKKTEWQRLRSGYDFFTTCIE